MIGGMMKSTSMYALVAAAGLALSLGSASAADLGGNCCADLEERVAELEATTVRKGNRRVSLTLSGQVNRATMFWDDGFNRNTYFGLDNTNSSTRFSMAGNAKINAEYSAGFSIVIDVADKARTFAVTNNGNAEDGGSGGGIAGGSYSGFNGDHLIRMRDANWWIQSERLGRITVGRLTTSGAIAGIDLGGVQVVANSSPGCVGGGLIFRDAATGLLTQSLNNYTDGCAYPTTRGEGIKWTSPTFQGFTVSASIAEAGAVERYTTTSPTTFSTTGRNLGVDLRYANEFNGVRVAFGVGYEKFEGNGDGVLNQPGTAAGDLTGLRTENWGLSAALLHVATGLFVQGDYIKSENTSLAYVGTRDADRWIVQAGVVRNWFGIGNTSLYGEYGQANDWLFARGINAVATDKVEWWGLGAVQTIDAAAMELYLGYRNFSASGFTATGVKDIDVVTAGARIRF
jgi:hypothetical protein